MEASGTYHRCGDRRFFPHALEASRHFSDKGDSWQPQRSFFLAERFSRMYSTRDGQEYQLFVRRFLHGNRDARWQGVRGSCKQFNL